MAYECLIKSKHGHWIGLNDRVSQVYLRMIIVSANEDGGYVAPGFYLHGVSYKGTIFSFITQSIGDRCA